MSISDVTHLARIILYNTFHVEIRLFKQMSNQDLDSLPFFSQLTICTVILTTCSYIKLIPFVILIIFSNNCHFLPRFTFKSSKSYAYFVFHLPLATEEVSPALELNYYISKNTRITLLLLLVCIICPCFHLSCLASSKGNY